MNGFQPPSACGPLERSHQDDGLLPTRFHPILRGRPSALTGTFCGGEVLLAIGGSQSAEIADPATRRTPMPTKVPKAQGAKAGPASSGSPKPNALQKPLQPSKELA